MLNARAGESFSSSSNTLTIKSQSNYNNINSDTLDYIGFDQILKHTISPLEVEECNYWGGVFLALRSSVDHGAKKDQIVVRGVARFDLFFFSIYDSVSSSQIHMSSLK